MNASKQTRAFQFRCQCGAVLKASEKMSGRKGKCKSCGFVQVIPAASQGETLADANETAVGIQEICSICQTVVEDDDDRTTCTACELPFHEECWEENLGCSAYGCENVNALKKGPDIKIGSQPGSASAVSSLPGYAGPASVPSKPVQQDSIIDYVLLGGSSVAVVLGFVSFGAPSFFAMLLAIARMARNFQTNRSPAIPFANIALSSVGGFVGFYLSIGFWR